MGEMAEGQWAGQERKRRQGGRGRRGQSVQ